MRSLDPIDPARPIAAMLDALPIIAYAALPDGRVTYLSPAWRSEIGIAREDALGKNYVDYLYPDDRERALQVWETARRAGTPYRDEIRFRFGDGTYHWLLSQARPLRDDDGEISGWFGTVTIIDERKRAELGLQLLSAIGAAAARSLGYQATLQNFAQATVDAFASYCIIDITGLDAPWERIVAHRDRGRVGRLHEMVRPTGTHQISRTVHDGSSHVLRIDEDWLRSVGATAERAAVVRDYRIRSVIIVPIRAPDGAVIGAITTGLDSTERTGRVYVEDDVPFVEEVGRRAGASIVNARLFERQRRIAVELQAASLPLALPEVPGVRLDAFYQPGSDEATIGGDWYDAFRLPDGRVAMTVGDVRGHGLQAAIAMTKLRQAMQSAAMVDADPGVMLGVADRTMQLLDPDAYATGLAAIYEPVTGSLALASAGHPGPLVVHAGTVEELQAPGPMLGLAENERYAVEHVRLPASSLLVFYTDGLIEATRDWDAGNARLRDALRGENPCEIGDSARRIVETVLCGVQATDDIAVLTACVDPVGAAVTLTAPSEKAHMNWSFSSDDAISARAVRHAFAAFVEAVDARIDAAGAELVLGELIGNVVRHAPGIAHVTASWTTEGIELTVASEGPCFTPPPATEREMYAESGRGLMLVRTFAGDLRVTGSARDCEVRVMIPFEPASA